jgi:hypothetical protein
LYDKAADFLHFLLTHLGSIKDCEQSEGSIKTTKPQFLKEKTRQVVDQFETSLETSTLLFQSTLLSLEQSEMKASKHHQRTL